MDYFSTYAKGSLNKFCKFYCNSLNIKAILTPSKVGDLFNVKHTTTKFLKFFVVYKVTFLDCNAC